MLDAVVMVLLSLQCIYQPGFNLPTADSDLLTVRYPDMFTMMEHLRGMGDYV